MNPEIEAAVHLLKENGYTVVAPIKRSPPPNGCFRVETSGGPNPGPYFVEGKIEEKEKIQLDFEKRGYTVEKIEFGEDRFYFF
jgi:hypothetical protein